MTALLVAVIVLLSVTLIALVVGVALYLKRLNKVVDETAQTLKLVRENVLPLAQDMRRVLNNMDDLVNSTRARVESIGHVVDSIEGLLEGKTITDAAGKVVSSSKSTLTSIFYGMKEKFKDFRSSRKQSKEESENE